MAASSRWLLPLSLLGLLQLALGHTRMARGSALRATLLRRRAPLAASRRLAMNAGEPSAAFLARFDAAARAMAADGGCDVSEVAWRSPVLCVEVTRETSSEQLQTLNVALSDWLDAQEAAGAADVPTGEFELEVGTPGVREDLTQVKGAEGDPIVVYTSDCSARVEGGQAGRDAR
jgi:hypothetical protein